MIGRQFIAFGFIVVGLVCNGQSTNALMATMNSFLKPHGKNPVHSIQVFISRGDEIFCESVGFSDGMRQQADKDNQFKIASITKTMTYTSSSMTSTAKTWHRAQTPSSWAKT